MTTWSAGEHSARNISGSPEMRRSAANSYWRALSLTHPTVRRWYSELKTTRS